MSDHINALRHRANYCYDCQRQFQNANNYQAHRNSRLHRPRGLLCPFCKNAYVLATGLFHHLESGSCSNAPKLNRHSILGIAHSRDPDGIITDRVSAEDYGSQTTYQATNAAFNGHHWECFFCKSNLRSISALNQHLNSPAHQQKVYHCPNRRCRKELKTLASLCNHLESESCNFIGFDRVQKKLGGMVTSKRMLKF